MDFDNIERANKPDNASERTSLLGEQSKKILSVATQKLKKDKYFPVTHSYLSKTTQRKERQNLYIIDELRDLFYIEYKRKFKFKGKIYLRCFVFSYKEIEYPNLQNDAKNYPLQTAEVYNIDEPLKNNSSERTRSNSDLIILKNPDLDIQKNNEENVDIKKDCYQKEFSQELESTDKNSGRIFRNGFLGKAKPLKEMEPYLTDEICYELRRLSDRDFTNKAMSEILQNIARKGSEVFFMHIKGFIAYMVKTLKGELRDVVKTSSENFYIKANKTPEELKKYNEQADINQYLNEIEQQSITNRSDETQFKARIANKLSPYTAYNFLKNLMFIGQKGRTSECLTFYLTHPVSLTPSEESRLLIEAQSIGGYAGIERLKICIAKPL